MKSNFGKLKLLVLTAVLFAVFSVCSLAASTVHGDVDGDKKLTTADARLALRGSVGLKDSGIDFTNKNSAAFIAADTDNDGEITASDARSLLRASVGLESLSHTYGNWQPGYNEKGIATGNHYAVCVCGNKKTVACTFGDKIYISTNKEPTCTKSTEYYTQCSVCGVKKSGGKKALGHSYTKLVKVTKEATCETNGAKLMQCVNCSGQTTVTIPAKGHQCKGQDFDISKPIICTVCKKEVMPSFNGLVNTLKTNTHKFTTFTHSTDTNTINGKNIKASLLLKTLMGSDDIEKMLTDSLASSNGESYIELGENLAITRDSFMIPGKQTVSELKSTDLTSLTVTPMSSIDFVSSLPAQQKIEKISGGTKTFDFSTIKAKANKKVNKVEIVLKQEKYSDFKNNKTETALMRITGTDVRTLADKLKNSSLIDMEKTEGMTFDVAVDIKEITTNCKVTYYFDYTTNEPLAAIYEIKPDVRSVTTMDFAIDKSAFGLGKGSDSLLSGTLDVTMKSVKTSYYFFDGYFK